MENPGLITFRDDNLLLDPAGATMGQRRSNAGVIAHELAHMWFGDLVTMAWWDDLWLNESFADWMAAKITDEVYPGYRDGLADLQRIQGVKSSDAQPSTRPIRDNTTSSAAGLQNVGLVYSKGNAVLSMFERYLGADVFQRGVRAYLREHAWATRPLPTCGARSIARAARTSRPRWSRSSTSPACRTCASSRRRAGCA
jgi:alanyl aminopeptidase